MLYLDFLYFNTCNDAKGQWPSFPFMKLSCNFIYFFFKSTYSALTKKSFEDVFEEAF